MVKELFTFFFQPPVMILVVLAVAGLVCMLGDRSERHYYARRQWRSREAWMRAWSTSGAVIQRSKRKFFRERGIGEW